MIDKLDTRSIRSSIGVAYVHFNHKDQDQEKPVTVLRSLIKQLIARHHALSSPIPQKVQLLYNSNCAADSTPKLEDLRDALVESLKLFMQTFFVFDALDECQEDIRKDFLPLIHWHWIAGGGTSRIFLTSRPYPQDIPSSLTSTDSNHYIQRLDLEAKDEDVIIYVDQTIQEHIKARNLITGDFRAKVISKLVDACKGM